MLIRIHLLNFIVLPLIYHYNTETEVIMLRLKFWHNCLSLVAYVRITGIYSFDLNLFRDNDLRRSNRQTGNLKLTTYNCHDWTSHKSRVEQASLEMPDQSEDISTVTSTNDTSGLGAESWSQRNKVSVRPTVTRSFTILRSERLPSTARETYRCREQNST